MNKKFNLESYATVDERIHLFYETYEDGRIITDRVTTDEAGNVEVFKAILYRTPAEQERNLPLSTGFAQEVRDEELQVSNKGYEYATVNYTSHLENCETSAIGRALANAGFTGNKNRPSREEMEKVQRRTEQPESKPKNTPKKEAIPEPPQQEEQPQTKVEYDNPISQKLSELSGTPDEIRTGLLEWWGTVNTDESFRATHQAEMMKRLQDNNFKP
jgi:hypothetical protein